MRRLHKGREAQLSERARAALDQGKPEQAAPLFREVLRSDPANFEANESLGLIVAEAGDYQQALGYFEKGSRSAPQEPVGHANLGATLLALDQDKRAVAELERAAALDPRNAQTLGNLARGWMKLKEPARAAKQFAAAAALEQPTAELLYNWALALYDSSAFEQASEVLFPHGAGGRQRSIRVARWGRGREAWALSECCQPYAPGRGAGAE